MSPSLTGTFVTWRYRRCLSPGKLHRASGTSGNPHYRRRAVHQRRSVDCTASSSPSVPGLSRDRQSAHRTRSLRRGSEISRASRIERRRTLSGCGTCRTPVVTERRGPKTFDENHRISLSSSTKPRRLPTIRTIALSASVDETRRRAPSPSCPLDDVLQVGGICWLDELS